MLNMNYQLRDLLGRVSEENVINNRYTHYTAYGPESKWKISDHHLTEFWDGYCSSIYNNIMNDQELDDFCLAEIPPNVIPLIQEFIFKFQDDEEDNWEPYDDQFLAHLCFLYQQMLIKFLYSS